LLILIALLGFLSHSSAQELKVPVALKMELKARTVLIADKVSCTLTATAEKDTEVQFPDFSKGWGDFTVKEELTRVRSFWGRKKITARYTLQTYSTGEIVLPAVVIRYKKKGQDQWQEIKTKEERIQVKSLLEGAGEEPTLKDIKGPMELPSAFGVFKMWWVVILALLLWGVGMYLLKRRNAFSPTPPRPAHEIAYAQLEELKKQELIRQGRTKEYYSMLSGIVRHYLENRFSLRAPDMTTEEFLFDLKGSSLLAKEHKELLKDFLSHCDLVKFAKYAPQTDEIEGVFQSAKRLVDQTKEVTEEPEGNRTR